MEHPVAKVREFHEQMKAEMRTIQANQQEMIVNMDVWKEGMEACVGKLEAN
jgi:hypothetical protein